jgi:hypothetical protein
MVMVAFAFRISTAKFFIVALKLGTLSAIYSIKLKALWQKKYIGE